MSLLLHNLIKKLNSWTSTKYYEAYEVLEGKYKIVAYKGPFFNTGIRNVYSKNRNDLSFNFPLAAKTKNELLNKEIIILESNRAYTFRRNLECSIKGWNGSNVKESGGSILAKVLFDNEILYLDISGLIFKKIED